MIYQPGPAALPSEASQIFYQPFLIFKVTRFVSGPVSAEELASVDVAPSARFANYRMKTNIVYMLVVLGLMENRFDGT